MVPGTSNSVDIRMDLPVCSVSAAASSPAISSSRAARACIAALRSPGVAPDHSGYADSATFTAARTSSGVAEAKVRTTSPVAGFVTTTSSGPEPSVKRPPTYWPAGTEAGSNGRLAGALMARFQHEARAGTTPALSPEASSR